jgi:predicted helicase
MKENPVQAYVVSVISEFKTGQAREHAYRPALKTLFESVVPKLQAVNDPKHSEHGAPDFALMRSKELSAGYVEAKDVTVNLDDTEKSEQMKRYLEYGSLILTNSLEFRFYRHGHEYGEPIVVAKIVGSEIVPNENAFSDLEDAIRTFLTQTERISSSAKLAKIMGDKARRIRDKVAEYVGNEHERNQELRRMYESFKRILIHDLTEEQFADMYAQTLVYGLFAARYEDKTEKDFTRAEARDLVPHSNPFLRSFFDHIVGATFDVRLAVIVNELCEVFVNADVHALMNSYVTQKGLHASDDKETADPVIHFYEDFLKEYDADKRKTLGAFYTPLPVVRFIIRSVDHLLKTEFGLRGGLSDTTKTDIKVTKQGKTAKESIHRVQVLDPATGTGTFLNEVVKYIATGFKGQEGRWKSYVESDLLPRLHGFELMMAPYTIAHLKIAMTLHDSGITDFKHRLGLYLTNSLEEGIKVEDSLFGGFGTAVTEESNIAARIKNDTPIMVVMGNPPYSGVSSNETDYANKLVDKYKVEPGGQVKLQERKHWLNDDYVKFIAFAEDMVVKNGEGVVGFITNHGYLDNPTFRGMRWHLMNTFDSIYVIDLHGNAKKKEVSPDGNKDENVFAIQQGVAIMIAVKTGKKKKGTLAKVYRSDIWGKQESKFEQLNKFSIENMEWLQIEARMPKLSFVLGGSVESEEVYQKGFSVNDLFIENSTGIVTMGDSFIIDEDRSLLEKRVEEFLNGDVSEVELKEKYDLGKNYAEWILKNKKDISNDSKKIIEFAYRPFDNRYTYFDNKLVWRPRTNVMKNFVGKENLGLIYTRQAIGGDGYEHILVSRNISDNRMFFSNKGIPIEAPLYLYAEDGSKIPNLKKEIVVDIEKVTGKVSPENILDYIYAVLHSRAYREKYKEFLKIDFPRVPYPKDAKLFNELVVLGKELRELHLMESPKLRNLVTTFPESGTDTVEAKFPKYKDGKVFINETQYFGGIPETAWNFYIGGYQPAQKWLKDRRGRKLTNQDIEHYQKMIVVLVETERVMNEVDKVM